MAAGLTATVLLDLLLIPSFGAVGAAIASAVAYTTTALALVLFFRRVERSSRPSGLDEAVLASADVH
jgi:Na+-driven multidrug efflux pump